MTLENMQQIGAQVQQHFAAQTYQQGLDYTTAALLEHPEDFPLINYWRACFAARLEQPALASQILETSLTAGTWYSDLILRQSPSFASLQGKDEFERVAAICAQMQTVDPAAAMPVLVVRPEAACAADGPGCPLAFFLHGNMDSVQANLPRWSPLALRGWLVGLPQSARAMWAGAYAWADYESAAEEVAGHFASVGRQYNVDPTQILLGGFSMGGEVALGLALSGHIPAQGFVLIGPGGPYMDDLEQWQPLLEQGRSRGLRGLILAGEADETIPLDNIRELVARLNQHGVTTELETIPGLAHEYPADFNDRLEYALKYIFG